jgi:CheY-like chemotaxis protein
MSAGPAPAPAAASARPLRILIVDDNADAAQTLALVLESAGHEVMVEYDPEAALRRAARQLPQACLLDIGLPQMSGHELARRLRQLPGMAGATLIALTGYGQLRDREQSRAAGFDHHLIKPVDAAALLALLSAQNPVDGETHAASTQARGFQPP